MGLLEIILIVLVVLFLVGGGFGYSRRGDWGIGVPSIFGVLLVIVVVVLFLRLL